MTQLLARAPRPTHLRQHLPPRSRSSSRSAAPATPPSRSPATASAQARSAPTPSAPANSAAAPSAPPRSATAASSSTTSPPAPAPRCAAPKAPPAPPARPPSPTAPPSPPAAAPSAATRSTPGTQPARNVYNVVFAPSVNVSGCIYNATLAAVQNGPTLEQPPAGRITVADGPDARTVTRQDLRRQRHRRRGAVPPDRRLLIEHDRREPGARCWEAAGAHTRTSDDDSAARCPRFGHSVRTNSSAGGERSEPPSNS